MWQSQTESESWSGATREICSRTTSEQRGHIASDAPASDGQAPAVSGMALSSAEYLV